MSKKREDEMVESTLTTPVEKDPGLFRDLWHQVRLVMRLMADADVPIYLKVLPIATVAYLLWPVDLIADILPGLGQMDDLMVLLVGSKVFIDLAPQLAVDRHLKNIREAAGYMWKGDEPTAVGEDDEIDDQIIIDGQVINEKGPEDIE